MTSDLDPRPNTTTHCPTCGMARAGWLTHCPACVAHEPVRRDNERLRDAVVKGDHETCQVLGKALGYPPLPADWNTDDVCTADHIPLTLAQEAAGRIAALTTENVRLRGEIATLREVLAEVTQVASAHVTIDTMDGHEQIGGLAAEVLAHKREAVERAMELLKGGA